jgi:hypothetical protein
MEVNMDEELSDIVARTRELPEEIRVKAKEVLRKSLELRQAELKLKEVEANAMMTVANEEHESGRKKYPNAEARQSAVFLLTANERELVLKLNDEFKELTIDAECLENVLKVNLAILRLNVPRE